MDQLKACQLTHTHTLTHAYTHTRTHIHTHLLLVFVCVVYGACMRMTEFKRERKIKDFKEKNHNLLEQQVWLVIVSRARWITDNDIDDTKICLLSCKRDRCTFGHANAH
jgi:hypothetical protein